jgi:hypothetical protein
VASKTSHRCSASRRVNSHRSRASPESRIQQNRVHWAGVDFVAGAPEQSILLSNVAHWDQHGPSTEI